jgi:hypothetical protein
LDATASSDPDKNRLSCQWLVYPEASGYRGTIPAVADPVALRTTVTVPPDAARQAIHLLAIVTDDGSPPLTRYARVILDVAK